MSSQPGKQNSCKHILPNISRCKGNQTIKFGQNLNISWEQKEPLRRKKVFCINFNWLSLNQIKIFFWKVRVRH